MQKCLPSVALLFVAVFAWSLDYQVKTVKVLPIESYPARATVQGITIAADPYPTDEKSFTAFDVKDLNTRGYYPVHVIIKNSTENFLSLKTRNVVLVTATGQELYTTSATVVVGLHRKGTDQQADYPRENRRRLPVLLFVRAQ